MLEKKEEKMPKYLVTNRASDKTQEVIALSPREACEKLGWKIAQCNVARIRENWESPFAA